MEVAELGAVQTRVVQMGVEETQKKNEGELQLQEAAKVLLSAVPELLSVCEGCKEILQRLAGLTAGAEVSSSSVKPSVSESSAVYSADAVGQGRSSMEKFQEPRRWSEELSSSSEIDEVLISEGQLGRSYFVAPGPKDGVPSCPVSPSQNGSEMDEVAIPEGELGYSSPVSSLRNVGDTSSPVSPLQNSGGPSSSVTFERDYVPKRVSETGSVRLSWANLLIQSPRDRASVNGGGCRAEGSPADIGSFLNSGSELCLEADEEAEAPEVTSKRTLTYGDRESIRFQSVERKKDFLCMECFKGRKVNVAAGLELHKNVFSQKEQKRLVKLAYQYQDEGRKGLLRERTYSEPRKWMRGKGRVTIQFGCCYNYALDRNGNPPGIMHNEMVDPLPSLLRASIRRLVKWHVIPEESIPDSCIINIYEEGDCIPPHIDHHDFYRPFCTLSLLNECAIVFGSSLSIVGPGDFVGPLSVPLPVGSVLVLNGNGADIAKHAVPAVPKTRISITFRRMDPLKVPRGYKFPDDLKGIKALPLLNSL